MLETMNLIKYKLDTLDTNHVYLLIIITKSSVILSSAHRFIANYSNYIGEYYELMVIK